MDRNTYMILFCLTQLLHILLNQNLTAKLHILKLDSFKLRLLMHTAIFSHHAKLKIMQDEAFCNTSYYFGP